MRLSAKAGLANVPRMYSHLARAFVHALELAGQSQAALHPGAHSRAPKSDRQASLLTHATMSHSAIAA